MNTYTMVDASGEILSFYQTTSSDSLTLNTPAGVTAIAQSPPGEFFYWLNKAWVAKPEKPSSDSAWNPVTKEWYDPRTLEEVRASKRAQINEWRLQANHAGFTHAGKEIATDPLSMLDITSTSTQIARTNRLPAGWPGGWKARDNTYIPITTVAQWDSFYEAMYQQGLANFKHSQALKALVDAPMATIAQVEGTNWSTAT